MALKMRFLYYSGKGKMKAYAEAIKTEFDLAQNFNAIDIIPPAYSCENERLVILAVSGKVSLMISFVVSALSLTRKKLRILHSW